MIANPARVCLVFSPHVVAFCLLVVESVLAGLIHDFSVLVASSVASGLCLVACPLLSLLYR